MSDWTVVYFFLAVVAGWSVESNPFGGGDFQRVPIDPEFDVNTGVKFYLYTADNITDAEQLDPNNVEQLRNSSFNSAHPTRFIIHGWLADRTSEVNRYIRNAYYQHSDPFNVIVVDWSAGAKTDSYEIARNRVPLVGVHVARFIDFMFIFSQLSIETTSLVGHSFGAHIAGLAGKNVLNGRLQSIVGLDPARSLFDWDQPSERLANTDAIYVETIHTDRGSSGFSRPIGDAAFYPNWGDEQLGCGDESDGPCSHMRAIYLFEESITRPENRWFNATRCRGYEDIELNLCFPTGYAAMGGEPLNGHTKEGVFFVETSNDRPFGLAID